jgi:hypothetical protein
MCSAVLRKSLVGALALGMLVFGLVGYASADPRISYPGTRARAMGGAFTAIASDSSAIWYNPAGLALQGKDIIVEYSSAVEMNKDTGRFDDSNESYFLASKWAKGDGSGFGLAFYQPYILEFTLPNTGFVNDYNETITGRLVENMNVFSFGFAGHLDKAKNFRLGGTVELLWLNYEDSTLYANGVPIDFYAGDTGAISFAASFGALYSLPVQPFGILTNLGATYRTKSAGSDTTGPVDLQGAEITLEKPSSWDIGISVAKSFTPIYSTLTLSAQMGSTDYGSMNDKFTFLDFSYEKTSFGAELVYSKKFLFFRDIALRGGVYSSENDNNYEVKGQTYGIGTRIGEQFGLEFASENRDFNGVYDVDLNSVAATWSF